MTEDYLVEIKDFKDLTPGVIIRRQGPEKIQQGGFVKLTDDNEGLILINVIDLVEISFAAEGGIIRPAEGDVIYRHISRFGESLHTEAAKLILTNWVLFRERISLQNEIFEFVASSYSPEHIMDLKKRDELQQLFIPVQERFKIGKFKEKIDWKKVRIQRFKDLLDSLEEGKHITYVAFIPQADTHHEPMFFSIGTKPHLETLAQLKRDPVAFRPNRGGHIKVVSQTNERPKKFMVDAGSNDLGSGTLTSKAIAEMVTDALSSLYPEHEYIPMAGRGAHGIQQSY